MAKGLKLKVRKFLVLNSTFVEVTGEELLGGLFATLIMNRVKKRKNVGFYETRLEIAVRRLI